MDRLLAEKRAEIIRGKVARAQASMAAGRVLSHDDVKDRVRSKIESLRA